VKRKDAELEQLRSARTGGSGIGEVRARRDLGGKVNGEANANGAGVGGAHSLASKLENSVDVR